MRLNWVNWFQLLPTPDHVQCTKVPKSIEGLTYSRFLESEIAKLFCIAFWASWQYWLIYKVKYMSKKFFFSGGKLFNFDWYISTFWCRKKVLRNAAMKYKGKVFLPCLTRNWIKLQKRPKNEVLLKYSKGLLK